MRRQRTPSKTADQIYADELFQLGYGLPLWEPAPTNYKKISIGDVGYVRLGVFHRLFNAMLPAEHEDNLGKAPPNFQRLHLLHPDYIYTRQPLQPRPLYVTDGQEKGLKVTTSAPTWLQTGGHANFETSASRGAILLTREKIFRKDHSLLGQIQKYFMENVDTWLKFANDRGYGITLEDIFFVTGHDTTSEYAMAAFSNSHEAFSLGFEINPCPGISLSGDVWGEWKSVKSIHQNCGPHVCTSPTIEDNYESGELKVGSSSDSVEPVTQKKFDQCLFVRRFKILNRYAIFTKVLKGNAGPRDFDGSSRKDGNDTLLTTTGGAEQQVEIEIEMDTPSFLDPLDYLASYIFENSAETSRAIIHDGDLSSILEAYYATPGVPYADLPTIIQKVAPIIIPVTGNYDMSLSTAMISHTSANVTQDDSPNINELNSLEEGSSQSQRALPPIMNTPELTTSTYSSRSDSVSLILDPKAIYSSPELDNASDFSQAGPRSNPKFSTLLLEALTTSDDPLLKQLNPAHNIPLSNLTTTHDFNPSPAPSDALMEEIQAWLLCVQQQDDTPLLLESWEDNAVGDNKPKQRPPGACQFCKRLKVRCVFPADSNACMRCKTTGNQCVVAGRKPRSGPSKREILNSQLYQDRAINNFPPRPPRLARQTFPPSILYPAPLSIHDPNPSDPHYNYHQGVRPEVMGGELGVLKEARLEGLSGKPFEVPGARKGEASAFLLEHDDAIGDEMGVEDVVSLADVVAFEDEGAGVREKDKGELHGLPEMSGNFHGTAEFMGPSSPHQLNTHNPASSLRNTDLEKPLRSAWSPSSTTRILAAEETENDNIFTANSAPGRTTSLSLRQVQMDRTMVPDILAHGLLTPADVDELFHIFYEKLNPFIRMLDSVIQTPQQTFGRCHFLFTVVCAISSRYYPPKANVYKHAMHFARSAAASNLIDGFKSVELCQAYLLMGIYSEAPNSWEEDRSWLYFGVAVGMATDLNLHRPSPTKHTSQIQERELLSRTRTWLICCNLDRSMYTCLGRPSMIQEEGVTRNVKEWYRRSEFPYPYEVQLCYTELFRVMTQFHEEVFSDEKAKEANRLNKKVGLYDITMKYNELLWQFEEDVTKRGVAKEELGYRLLLFHIHYSRLVIFSFGFQRAIANGIKCDIYFERCFGAAYSVITTVIERIAPTTYLRFAPDSLFIFTSFAAAFLIKLLRPAFSGTARPYREKILSLVEKLVQLFSSPGVAVDDKHTPMLYSRFLENLVERCSEEREDGTRNNQQGERREGQQQQRILQPQLQRLPTSQLTLASMQAINSPTWWENVLMPGFTWPSDGEGAGKYTESGDGGNEV